MKHSFANGLDQSPVAQMGIEGGIKGIGNSTTMPRDLVCDNDVRLIMFVLYESVAARLYEHGLIGRTVQIYVRDVELSSFERQGKLSRASNLSGEIHKKAMELFSGNYNWLKPIRSIGVRVTYLCSSLDFVQLSVFEDEVKRKKLENLQETVIKLRGRFGHHSIGRAVLLGDKMGKINPKDDHTIFPVGYFKDRLP